MQTKAILSIFLLISLIGFAMYFKQSQSQISDLQTKISQITQQRDTAKMELFAAQQVQQQMQQQLDAWQQQTAQRRANLDDAVRQNPDWSAQKLPENIKKAIEK